MQKKVIAMAGGGTGGHVFPIRSLLQTLFSTQQYADKIDKIYWFWSSNSLESTMCTELKSQFATSQETKKSEEPVSESLHFIPILSGKYRREATFKAFCRNVSDFFKLFIGTIQSCYYLQKYHINTVFCKGGYVALPLVFATKILKKKLIVHESDTRPGLVNRIAARRAETTFSAFPEVLPNAQVVGQILSDDLVAPDEKKRGVDNDKNLLPQLFITAGSQWAKTLYETLATLFDTERDLVHSFRIIISLGQLNQELAPRFTSLGDNITTYDFLTQSQMGEVYQETDICITRGGTTSLAEQKLFNIKSIIIPLPRTHDQAQNAKYYADHYQDIVLDQRSPFFIQDLEQSLSSLSSYRKHKLLSSPLQQIQQTKNLILETILS